MLGSQSIEVKSFVGRRVSISALPTSYRSICWPRFFALMDLCFHPCVSTTRMSAQNGEHMLSELAWRRHCFPQVI